MIRNGVGKVMWVGRATVFLVGLAVILALVFGVASTAFGANGKPFLLGKKNVASAISTLVKQGPGPALNLVVGAGQPPLQVNSSGKVANLNADQLDGLDSTAFGITTEHNFTRSEDCDDPAIQNQCGKVQVVVPPGKQYLVSVWSTMSWKGGSTEQTISYCSARDNDCITPFGPRNYVTVPAGKFVSASSEGETLPLSEGTYTFNTKVDTEAQVAGNAFFEPSGGVVITKVMVRDASAPQLTGVSLVP